MDLYIAPSRLVEVLTSGGDSRLALDPYTGRNKYHCPLLPAPETICFASCTSSPLSVEGLHAATAMLEHLRDGMAVQTAAIALAARLRGVLGLEGLADVLLTPSGTDATLLVTGLLAAEQPAMPIVSIMVAAAETGSGVPLAAAGRHYSGDEAGMAIAGFAPGTQTQTVALRAADGDVRPSAWVNAAFAAAVAATEGRPVVHLIDCSKTGQVAPSVVPEAVDVVVDACQTRLPLTRLRDYLRRGWPVLITGSKFFGGPAFSGAILFPTARLARIDRMRMPSGLAMCGVDASADQPWVNAGTVLRWAAALDEIARFVGTPAADAQLDRLCRAVASGIAASPGLVAIASPAAHGIFAIALRDPADPGRLFGMTELREHHRVLAEDGILLGQPVEIGASQGALRIAIGARNLRDVAAERNVELCLEALRGLRQQN